MASNPYLNFVSLSMAVSFSVSKLFNSSMISLFLSFSPFLWGFEL